MGLRENSCGYLKVIDISAFDFTMKQYNKATGDDV